PISRLKRDVSFDEYLRSRRGLSKRMCAMAWNFVEGYHASHADRISARVLEASDEELHGENKQFRIANGYDALIRWLAAGLDPERTELRFGTVANLVQWSEGEVVVNETFRAKKLVVTIPIGVWKSG